MEKVLEPGYQNWEQYVEALCDNFGALFPDIPNILLDKTFQKLMVTPVEGDCCPQPRYRCSLLQQKAWDTGSESKRGLCFFCQKPFRMGRPANASWNDEKEDFLNNWLDSFFSKFLMLPAEASTKAAHVAVLLLLAGNCGEVGSVAKQKCVAYVAQNAPHFAQLPRKLNEETVKSFCSACFIGSTVSLSAITELLQHAGALQTYLHEVLINEELFDRKFQFSQDLRKLSEPAVKFLSAFVDRELPHPVILRWKNGWDVCLPIIFESQTFRQWHPRARAYFWITVVDWNSQNRPIGGSAFGKTLVMELASLLQASQKVVWPALRVLLLDEVERQDLLNARPVQLMGPVSRHVEEISDVSLASSLLMSEMVSHVDFSVKFLDIVAGEILLHLESRPYISNLRPKFYQAQRLFLTILPSLSPAVVQKSFEGMDKFIACLDRVYFLRSMLMCAPVVTAIRPLIRFWPVETISSLKSLLEEYLPNVPLPIRQIVVAESMRHDNLSSDVVNNLADHCALISGTQLLDKCRRADFLVELICCGSLRNLTAEELLMIISFASDSSALKINQLPACLRRVQVSPSHGAQRADFDRALNERLRFGSMTDWEFVAQMSVFSFFWDVEKQARRLLLAESLYKVMVQPGSTPVTWAYAFDALGCCMGKKESFLLHDKFLSRVDMFKLACRIDNRNVFALCHFGYVGSALELRSIFGDGSTPEAVCLKAIEIDPSSPVPYMMAASKPGIVFQLQKGMRELVVKAIDLDSSNALAYVRLGALLNAGESVALQDGRHMTARQLYLHAVKLNPNISSTLAAAARVLTLGETININGKLYNAEDLRKLALQVPNPDFD